MIGKIGLHVTANLLLPGVGSALVIGGNIAKNVAEVASTLVTLASLKKFDGNYNDDDKKKAGYYATKFIF